MSAAEDIFGRIADGELVIIDGGTGTQLQAEGVPMDDVAWSARANLEHPDVVQRVHEEYIRAGAEVIIANTYAASRAALMYSSWTRCTTSGCSRFARALQATSSMGTPSA